MKSLKRDGQSSNLIFLTLSDDSPDSHKALSGAEQMGDLMRATFLTVCVIVLVGCAGTPEEMRQLGVTQTLKLPQTPREASECSAIKLDNRSNSTNTIRHTENFSYILGNSAGYNLWTIDFYPSDGGSEVKVFVSDNAMFRDMLSRELSEAVAKCR